MVENIFYINTIKILNIWYQGEAVMDMSLTHHIYVRNRQRINLKYSLKFLLLGTFSIIARNIYFNRQQIK